MSTQPQRLQLSRRKGWKKSEGAIVVSRPSRWGNPFRVERGPDGSWDILHGDEILLDPSHATKDAAIRAAVEAFRVNLLCGALPFTLEDVKRELRGRDLLCWCKTPKAGERDWCHAAELLFYAAEPTEAEMRA